MVRSKSQSIKALEANALVENLQQYFVSQLNKVAASTQDESFEKVEWFRDQGRHGGGVRYVANNGKIFNRASVNVSQIHYDDDGSKGLASATAISTIIHPENPFAPSVHMHISWTEMKRGKGYWRMMADLNPAIEIEGDKYLFGHAIKEVVFKNYELASAQGDQYFYIPALERHRGVSHFYLEEYNSGDLEADLNLAKTLGKTVIDSYIQIFSKAVKENKDPAEEAYKKQLAYHTLYLFQVLTLDRGTTSGLLVHNQNDVGIMGSLPAQIDKTLLSSWKKKLLVPQNLLLQKILDVLPNNSPCIVDEYIKIELAEAVRQHYQENSAAISMQAQGGIIPNTVSNHQ